MKNGLVVLALLTLSGCTKEAPPVWNGWLEGEYVAVSPRSAGTISEVGVRSGQDVKAGQALYRIEAVTEQNHLKAAQAGLDRARANLADLSKGRRASELEAVEAQLRQAQAAETLSRREWRRRRILVDQAFIAPQQADEARAAHQRDQAVVREIRARLKTARLAARNDELSAARADVAASAAQLAQAEWQLRQKTVDAPVAGRVEDVFYRAGEWVNAGQPVLQLLPPDRLKVRFFIPQPDLGRVNVGQTLQMSCDGCGRRIAVRLDYVANQPEYTPPVIYSRENRAALMYRAEAGVPRELAPRLHVGQPVDIHPPR